MLSKEIEIYVCHTKNTYVCEFFHNGLDATKRYKVCTSVPTPTVQDRFQTLHWDQKLIHRHKELNHSISEAQYGQTCIQRLQISASGHKTRHLRYI